MEYTPSVCLFAGFSACQFDLHETFWENFILKFLDQEELNEVFQVLNQCMKLLYFFT